MSVKRSKLGDWLLSPAVAAFVLFWYLALTGALATLPHQENHITNNSGPECTTYECKQEYDERALTNYTAKLAWFTGILALVSSVQGFVLWRADQATRRALETTAKIGADMAAFNERQIAIAGAQSDVQIAQKEIARQQYLAAFRSRLRVRLVRIRPPVDGGQVYVEFDIINVGTFAAVVTSAVVTLKIYHIFEDGHSGEKSWRGAVSMPQQIIKAGESVSVSEPSNLIWRNWSFPNMGPWREEGNIHIIGLITYTDDAEIIRRTGFYRVSTDDTNRFIRMGNPDIEADYEYED